MILVPHIQKPLNSYAKKQLQRVHNKYILPWYFISLSSTVLSTVCSELLLTSVLPSYGPFMQCFPSLAALISHRTLDHNGGRYTAYKLITVTLDFSSFSHIFQKY